MEQTQSDFVLFCLTLSCSSDNFKFILFFYSIDALYILAFLRDFGTLFTYVWIIPLTLYSIKDVDKSQKYKMNVIILASLLIAYYLHYIFIFEGTQVLAVIIQNIA